jgi:hypothetical protein
MAIWIKPNGNEIEVNDLPATIEYAKSLKWKLKGEKKETQKKEVSKQKVS